MGVRRTLVCCSTGSVRREEAAVWPKNKTLLALTILGVQSYRPEGRAGIMGLADAADARSRVNAALIAVLGIIAIYFFIYPVWRSQFFVEFWYTEGWNAYFQDAAASGKNIYPAPGSLIVNNYPPLSFYAVGLLGRIFGGDNLFVGRALSLIALIVVSIEIFFVVRILAGGQAGASIGALWYAAIMSHNFTSFVGANDPQLAGQAIMGAGLALFLDRDRAGRSTIAPLLIMVAGGFWKHTMIAIPLTAIVWLLIRHGRKSICPIAVSAAASCGGLAAYCAVFGQAFLSNLLVARQYSIGHMVSQVGHLQWSAVAFAIWISWAIASKSTEAKRFTLIHVPIAFGACILQWFGDKVYGNAEFDWIIALAIAVGIAFESVNSVAYTYTARGVVIVALLILRLVATDRQEPMLVMFDPKFREKFSTAERAAVVETKQVAAIKGDVYCASKIICRAAGKPFAVDDFAVEEMVATKAISQASLDQMLRALHVTTFKGYAANMTEVDASLMGAIRAGEIRPDNSTGEGE
jgi:hypothetical protein